MFFTVNQTSPGHIYHDASSFLLVIISHAHVLLIHTAGKLFLCVSLHGAYCCGGAHPGSPLVGRCPVLQTKHQPIKMPFHIVPFSFQYNKCTCWAQAGSPSHSYPGWRRRRRRAALLLPVLPGCCKSVTWTASNMSSDNWNASDVLKLLN